MNEAAKPELAGRIALLGNPNVGKTTLFNRLSGSRHKTSNFPGTTQEAVLGRITVDGVEHQLVDLPGIYALNLDSSESSVCRAVLNGNLAPEGEAPAKPDTLVVVADSTNLLRNLALVAEAARFKLPTVVVLNMVDLARRRGIHADESRLSEILGCPVVAMSAKSGENVDSLSGAIAKATAPTAAVGDSEADAERWADETYSAIAAPAPEDIDDDHDALTDRLDRAFTHPVLGIIAFAAIMTGLFWVIFSLAAYPMDWIDAIFASLGGWVEATLPEGAVRDLLANGVVAGIGGTVIFLPQICLLFLLISLLESTGYLARAAFVIDRVMRPFGLSGHSFVPLLSSHACALPGIMACRAIPDRRDRLATILVAPFMSCSARIPVYVLLVVILFPESPTMQAVAFAGCYIIGALAGLLSALIARRSFLKGKSSGMALELPSYRAADLVLSLKTSAERGWVFLKKAGTVILAISILLWWLGAYPNVGPAPESEALRTQAAQVETVDPDRAEQLTAEADILDERYATQRSYLGRIGSTIQPVFAPLGYDRQLTIGVMASFAAREVFATTMAVQVAGTDEIEDEGVQNAIATAQRDDGTPVFTTATSWSLLIYYILAMQCLPTLVVTAREAGGAKWAFLQLGWMCGTAYLSAMIVYQTLRATGLG
ncbi:MAG: ferrous iron transporter B [bacterium]|nr:ferrous iron transporter B [bacterium]